MKKIKNKHKYNLNLIFNTISLIRHKKIQIYKKHFYTMYEAIKHHKDWMFFDNEISNIEILEPTIDNLQLMTNYNYTFVVKGFKSLTEFTYFNKIRYKYGVATMMYATRCMGNDIIAEAISNMINNEQLPSHEEIKQSIENNRLTTITNNNSEQKVKEKLKYQKLSEKYSIIWHRRIFELIKQHRVEHFNVLL